MKKVGRNDPCPCGSGKKYKKCCEAVPSKKIAAHEIKGEEQQQKALSVTNLFKARVAAPLPQPPSEQILPSPEEPLPPPSENSENS